MLSVPKILSAELDGIEAYPIEVEADINVGLHSFSIVGLADKAVSEAKERVNSALKNCGIKPPTKENRRITINLAPADVKKAGSRFDLPIALAYLLATDQIKKFETSDKMFVGELSLDGALRSVSGCLNISILAKNLGIKFLFVPEENALEASIIESITIVPVKDLKDLIKHLENITEIPSLKKFELEPSFPQSSVSIDDIKGQEAAKRALVIAASGGHNVLFYGPPGTGKTMLAQAFLSIVPPPSKEEIIEITQIWSAAGLTIRDSYIDHRPFRAPHHTSSLISVIGGGSNPKPGEISLAHSGILFLDEMPEFHRDILEGLRQPLENGKVHISRAKKALVFPARFILISAMNPCPCGYFGDNEKDCKCTANEVLRYQKKISGPLLDRIDLQIEVPRIPIEDLRSLKIKNEESTIRQKIITAREAQKERFKKTHVHFRTNSDMSSKYVDAYIHIDEDAEDFLKTALERSFISPRGYYRILKVARTIGDLEKSETIKKEHLAEAFQYRLKVNE